MFHDNMYIQKKEKKNHQRRLKKLHRCHQCRFQFSLHKNKSLFFFSVLPPQAEVLDLNEPEKTLQLFNSRYDIGNMIRPIGEVCAFLSTH